MWVSMCFPRAVDSYFIVKKRPYSLAKIATGGVRPGYLPATAQPTRVDRATSTPPPLPPPPPPLLPGPLPPSPPSPSPRRRSGGAATRLRHRLGVVLAPADLAEPLARAREACALRRSAAVEGERGGMRALTSKCYIVRAVCRSAHCTVPRCQWGVNVNTDPHTLRVGQPCGCLCVSLGQ